MKKEEKDDIITERDLKSNSETKKNSVAGKIFNIVFWVLISCLFIIWIIDFLMVKAEKKPIFCIAKTTHTFDEGKVDECLGLGYKVYNYDLTNKQAIEFGPFFIKIDTET